MYLFILNGIVIIQISLRVHHSSAVLFGCILVLALRGVYFTA